VNGGRVLDRAVRVLADWRVLLAALVGAVLLFCAQTLVRAAASAVGLIPRVAPWTLAPSNSGYGTQLAYAAVFLVATIPVMPFTSGLVLHAVARSLAQQNASLGAVWRAAGRTWSAFLVPVAASAIAGQLALVLRPAATSGLTVGGVLLLALSAAVGLWALLTEAAIAVTGGRFGPAGSSSLRIIRTRALSVLGAALLLGIPAAMVALAVIAMVALPGFGDVMKSSAGLAQALFTLAVTPVVMAFTSGGFVELYVQLTAPLGTQQEA
jgi:hypothetical protein